MTENTSKKKTFEERAAAKPTELHERFAQWLLIQTGVKPDLKTVQLACAFRMDFQRSDENQSKLVAKKEAAAAKEAERIAKRKAALEKELAKLSGTAEAATEAPAEPVAEEAAPDAPQAAEKPAETATEAKAEPAETATVETAPKARRSRRTPVATAETA